jgi:hypothetical protein
MRGILRRSGIRPPVAAGRPEAMVSKRFEEDVVENLLREAPRGRLVISLINVMIDALRYFLSSPGNQRSIPRRRS